jgi:hypothetical protein
LVAQGVDFAGTIDVSNIATQEPEVADVRKQDMTPKAPTAVEISDKKKAQLKKSGKELVSVEEREEGSVSGSGFVNKLSTICVA